MGQQLHAHGVPIKGEIAAMSKLAASRDALPPRRAPKTRNYSF
jgi:hypothetical protein